MVRRPVNHPSPPQDPFCLPSLWRESGPWESCGRPHRPLDHRHHDRRRDGALVQGPLHLRLPRLGRRRPSHRYLVARSRCSATTSSPGGTRTRAAASPRGATSRPTPSSSRRSSRSYLAAPDERRAPRRGRWAWRSLGAVGRVRRGVALHDESTRRARSSPCSGPSTAAGRSRPRPGTPGTSRTRGCRGASTSSSAPARPRAQRVVDLAGGGVASRCSSTRAASTRSRTPSSLLGVYALLLAIARAIARARSSRSRPLGALGVALAAPKLFPLLDGFGKAPRLIESTETLDLGALVRDAHLARSGLRLAARRASRPTAGTSGASTSARRARSLLLLGVVFVQGRREAALKARGRALRRRSASAPSTPTRRGRCSTSTRRSSARSTSRRASSTRRCSSSRSSRRPGIGRFIARRERAHPWLDAAAAALVARARRRHRPRRAEADGRARCGWSRPTASRRAAPFHFEQEPPFQYKRRDWAGPMYLAMLGNTGVINCYGTPPFDRKGARPVERARLPRRGLRSTGGRHARKVAAWSPNRVVIDVEGAEPGRAPRLQHELRRGLARRHGPGGRPSRTRVATRAPGGRRARHAAATGRRTSAPGSLVAALAVGALALAPPARAARRSASAA